MYVILSAAGLAGSVFLNVLFIAVLGYGIYGFVFSGLISALLVGLLSLMFIWRKFYFSPNKQLIVRLFKYSYPFVFSGFLSAFAHNIALICLLLTNDLSQAGIYAVGQKIGSITSVIGSSIVMAWTPYMFKVAKASNAPVTYAKGALIITTLMLGVTLGLTVLSVPIIELMTESSYYEGSIVILPVCIGITFFILTPTLRMGINLNDKTILIPLISFLSGGVGFAMTLYLTWSFGMYGAACGFAITWMLNAVFTVWQSNRYLSVPYDIRGFSFVAVSFVLSLIFYFRFQEMFFVSLFALLIFPVLLIVSGVFRGELVQLYGLLKRRANV